MTRRFLDTQSHDRAVFLRGQLKQKGVVVPRLERIVAYSKVTAAEAAVEAVSAEWASDKGSVQRPSCSRTGAAEGPWGILGFPESDLDRTPSAREEPIKLPKN